MQRVPLRRLIAAPPIALPPQGGALGSVACVVRQRHPADPRRPLIDYSLALVLTPTLLLGCNTGQQGLHACRTR